jgi:hypothetical protein
MRSKNILAAVALCLSPFILCALVTSVGLVVHSIPLISGAGLAFFFILFHLFAFADRIIKFAENIRDQHRNRHRRARQVGSGIAQAFVVIFSAVGALPLQAAIMVRAILLSSAVWVVGLYESLAQGGVHQAVDDWGFSAVQTVLSLSLGALDSARGKTIERPGWATRVLSVWGYFQLLRGLVILFCGVQGPEPLFTMRDFLSHPLWFTDPWIKGEMLRLSVEMGLGFTALLFLFVPIVVFITGLKGLFSEIADAQNFSLSMLMMSMWFLSYGVFEIFFMFYHVR